METNNCNNLRPAGDSGKRPRSIYERAASDGAWLGLWFVALFGLSVAALRIAPINILVMVMAMLVPFIVYRRLRRTYVDSHGLTTYSALWMQGILTFGCGSLILGAAAFIFMRWIYPDFIIDTLRAGIEFYRNESSGAGADIADEFQAIIDHRLIPTPFTIAMAWMWLGLFSGSVLSMLLAAVARIAKVPVNFTNKPG